VPLATARPGRTLPALRPGHQGTGNACPTSAPPPAAVRHEGEMTGTLGQWRLRTGHGISPNWGNFPRLRVQVSPRTQIHAPDLRLFVCKINWSSEFAGHGGKSLSSSRTRTLRACATLPVLRLTRPRRAESARLVRLRLRRSRMHRSPGSAYPIDLDESGLNQRRADDVEAPLGALWLPVPFV
jgi:hypothetical protein